MAVIILTAGGDLAHRSYSLYGISEIRGTCECFRSVFAGTLPLTQRSGYVACAIIASIAIIDCMANITIRNLEETTKRKLKIRAAMNGRSMEQEAREILKVALARTPQKKANPAERIREIFGPLGGVELERLPREAIREPEWLAEKE